MKIPVLVIYSFIFITSSAFEIDVPSYNKDTFATTVKNTILAKYPFKNYTLQHVPDVMALLSFFTLDPDLDKLHIDGRIKLINTTVTGLNTTEAIQVVHTKSKRLETQFIFNLKVSGLYEMWGDYTPTNDTKTIFKTSIGHFELVWHNRSIHINVTWNQDGSLHKKLPTTPGLGADPDFGKCDSVTYHKLTLGQQHQPVTFLSVCKTIETQADGFWRANRDDAWQRIWIEDFVAQRPVNFTEVVEAVKVNGGKIVDD